MLPSVTLPSGTDGSSSRSSSVERPTQFRKQVLLLGEIHDLEIAQIRKSHVTELRAIQEENARLREHVKFMQRVLPKEHQAVQEVHSRPGDRDALLDNAAPRNHEVQQDMNTSWNDRMPLLETVVPEASSGVKTTASEDLHFGHQVAKIEGTADVIDIDTFCNAKENLTTASIDVIDVDGFCSTKENLTIAGLGVMDVDGFRSSTIDFSLESETHATVRDSQVKSGHSSSSLDSKQSAIDSKQSAKSYASMSPHASLRAGHNWVALCGRVLLLFSKNASRLHPEWQSAASQLARLADRTSSMSKASSDITNSLYSTVSDHNLRISGKVTHRFAKIHTSTIHFEQSVTVLDPGSKIKMLWDVCSVLWCMHDFIVLPMQFVGLMGTEDNSELVRTWLSSIFWTGDIFVSISTGYYGDDSTVEFRRSKILIHYAKTWMLFDVCIIVPDWFSLLFSSSGSSVGLGIMRITRLVRMVRLMRAIRLLPKLLQYIGRMNSERISTMARIVVLIIMIAVINHYLACLVLGTWTEPQGYQPPVNGYLRCLHWALAHSTLGSMDMFPETSVERLSACLVLLCSMVLFSTFLSSITNAVRHMGLLAEEQRHQESLVRNFFAEHHISRELSGQIWHFMSHYRGVVSRTKLDDVEVFNCMPTRLHAKLSHQTFLPYLLVHPLFEVYNRFEPEALVMLCSNGIEQKLLQPLEEYACDLRAVTRMIFVNSGSLVYQPRWSIEDDVQVGHHHWVCEEALWAETAKLEGPLIAELRGADLMLLVPAVFRSISRNFTTSMPILVSYADLFCSNFNEACLDDTYENLLFNDHEMIHGLVISALNDGNSKRRFSERTQRGILMTLFGHNNRPALQRGNSRSSAP